MDYRNMELVAEFKKILTPDAVRPLQLIHAALAMGVLSFGGVVLFMYFVTPPGDGENASVVFQLSVVHGAMALACFPGSSILYSWFLKKDSGNSALSAARTPLGILGVIRTASILRIAAMEGAAFFGLVVTFLAVTGGVVRSQPLYWLNMLSAVLMVGAIALSFPTPERLVRIFQEKMSAD